MRRAIVNMCIAFQYSGNVCSAMGFPVRRWRWVFKFESRCSPKCWSELLLSLRRKSLPSSFAWRLVGGIGASWTGTRTQGQEALLFERGVFRFMFGRNEYWGGMFGKQPSLFVLLFETGLSWYVYVNCVCRHEGYYHPIIEGVRAERIWLFVVTKTVTGFVSVGMFLYLRSTGM